MKKAKEREILSEPRRSTLLCYISAEERELISPCKKCRKRDSCFLKVKDGKCVAFEAREPFKY